MGLFDLFGKKTVKCVKCGREFEKGTFSGDTLCRDCNFESAQRKGTATNKDFSQSAQEEQYYHEERPNLSGVNYLVTSQWIGYDESDTIISSSIKKLKTNSERENALELGDLVSMPDSPTSGWAWEIFSTFEEALLSTKLHPLTIKLENFDATEVEEAATVILKKNSEGIFDNYIHGNQSITPHKLEEWKKLQLPSQAIVIDSKIEGTLLTGDKLKRVLDEYYGSGS